MLIFNTTFHVEDEVHNVYLNYMKERYIPKATESGFLHTPSFARIHSQHGEGGSSYSLQFRVKNSDTLNYWFEKEGQLLNNDIALKFGNKVVGFTTLLEEIAL